MPRSVGVISWTRFFGFPMRNRTDGTRMFNNANRVSFARPRNAFRDLPFRLLRIRSFFFLLLAKGEDLRRGILQAGREAISRCSDAFRYVLRLACVAQPNVFRRLIFHLPNRPTRLFLVFTNVPLRRVLYRRRSIISTFPRE